MTDQLQYLEDARAFLNELAEKPPRVPYEPELLPMLFSATRENSSASMDDIARLIERSQNLATRLLNIANSAYYVLEFKVTSLSRAISVLGLKEVRSLVLTVGMVSAIKGVKLPKNFDAHALWMHHIRTASLAKALTAAIQNEAAPKAGKPENKLSFEPDEAYVAGLLHDLGKVFLAASRPAVWQAIEDICKAENCQHFEAEMEYWGMDHGIIASRVLHTWKVPLLLTDAINWHHAPQLAPQGRLEAGLLSAANRLDNAGYIPGNPIDDEIMELLPQGLDAEVLREAIAQRLANDRNAALSGVL
jgi:HD-like signal output (HDOD) protein